MTKRPLKRRPVESVRKRLFEYYARLVTYRTVPAERDFFDDASRRSTGTRFPGFL